LWRSSQPPARCMRLPPLAISPSGLSFMVLSECVVQRI
jgi:hypothetical protein